MQTPGTLLSSQGLNLPMNALQSTQSFLFGIFTTSKYQDYSVPLKLSHVVFTERVDYLFHFIRDMLEAGPYKYGLGKRHFYLFTVFNQYSLFSYSCKNRAFCRPVSPYFDVFGVIQTSIIVEAGFLHLSVAKYAIHSTTS